LCNFRVYFSLVTQEIKQSVVKGGGKEYTMIFREGKKEGRKGKDNTVSFEVDLGNLRQQDRLIL
jgi:secreted protein with Ig-like and vWFA domain